MDGQCCENMQVFFYVNLFFFFFRLSIAMLTAMMVRIRCMVLWCPYLLHRNIMAKNGHYGRSAKICQLYRIPFPPFIYIYIYMNILSVCAIRVKW